MNGMSRPRKLYVKSYGCQMNVYDSHRMADTLAPEGFVETATPDDADLIILNTCHIREKAAEKVYSELGRLRVMKDEAARDGRRVTVAVAGCVAQAEGKEIIRRAPAVDLVVGPQSYHRLPAMLARAEHEKVVDTEFPVENKFDQLARAEPRRDAQARRRRLRHRAGRLRQVLHLLRRALHARRRSVAAGREDRRRSRAARRRGRARDHADRPERQRLSRRRAGRPRLDARQAAAPPRRNPRRRAAALHHEPSARHGRRADRRASRPAGADAASASAGAVRLRPHPRGDEPPAHARGLSPGHRPAARGATRLRVLLRLHRRLPGRDRGGFPRDASALCPRSATPAPIRSSIRRGRARPPPRWSRCRKRSRTSACSGCKARSTASSTPSTPAACGPHARRAVRKTRPASWPDRRQLPISAVRPCHGADRADRRNPSGDGHRRSAATPCPACWRAPDAQSRPKPCSPPQEPDRCARSDPTS